MFIKASICTCFIYLKYIIIIIKVCIYEINTIYVWYHVQLFLLKKLEPESFVLCSFIQCISTYSSDVSISSKLDLQPWSNLSSIFWQEYFIANLMFFLEVIHNVWLSLFCNINNFSCSMTRFIQWLELQNN